MVPMTAKKTQTEQHAAIIRNIIIVCSLVPETEIQTISDDKQHFEADTEEIVHDTMRHIQSAALHDEQLCVLSNTF